MTSVLNNISLSGDHKYNIIIFGESGVGKSALINQIYDQTVVKSSSQAVGCTTESVKVSGILKDQDHSHLSFDLYDTAGLSESMDGAVPTTKAFVQLIKLAYTVPNGINLLICCAEKGRLSGDRFKANYRVFKEELCEDMIPCLLVLTRCDEDDPLNQWWLENEKTVSDTLKFNFVDAVCVSTLKTKKKEPGKILQDYVVSRASLIKAITKCALPKPISIDSWSRKVIVAARSFYNSFTRWFSWLGLRQTSLRPELVQMFIDLHYTPEEAKIETERLLRELAQGDLLAPYKTIDV